MLPLLTLGMGLAAGVVLGWLGGVTFAARRLAQSLKTDSDVARQLIEDLGAKHGFKLEMFQLPGSSGPPSP